MKNLSNNDLQGELPSLDQVNLPFCNGISMRETMSINLLNNYIPLVLLPKVNLSRAQRVILKSPPMHQATDEQSAKEDNSGQTNFLSLQPQWP